MFRLVDLTLRAPYGTTVAPTAALLHMQSIIYVFGQHAGARVDGWRKTFQESLRKAAHRRIQIYKAGCPTLLVDLTFATRVHGERGVFGQAAS